jgi:hypothetical protein
MLCYECSKAGRNREAVGLCHHCSVGLCADDACIVADPVTKTYPFFGTVVRPKKARLVLCGTCLQALGQTRTETMTTETSEEYCVSSIAEGTATQ